MIYIWRAPSSPLQPFPFVRNTFFAQRSLTYLGCSSHTISPYLCPDSKNQKVFLGDVRVGIFQYCWWQFTLYLGCCTFLSWCRWGTGSSCMGQQTPIFLPRQWFIKNFHDKIENSVLVNSMVSYIYLKLAFFLGL